MRMNRMGALLLGAGMITMAACSDSPTSPATVKQMGIGAPSFAVGDLTNNTPQVGTVKVCKAGNAGGSFDVTRTAVGTSAGTVSGLNTLIATGECRIVALDDSPAENGSNVTITEDAAANTVSAVTGCVFIGGEPPVVDVNPCAFNPGSRFINHFHGYVVTYTNTFTPPPTGNQGCTPGYWKQEQHFGNWEVALSTTFAQAGMNFGFTGTLLSGLNANGGGVQALARHAAAAYLNSLAGSGVNYAYTTAQVQAIANGTGAYSGLSIEARKNLLAAANEGVGGCPLARAELS